MPRWATPWSCSRRKSSSLVKTTRPSATAKATWSVSSGPSRLASAVVVTPIPRRRRPSATAELTCSSRWNWIVLGILPYQLVIQGRGVLAFHLFDKGRFFPHLELDFVAVVPVVRKRRIHVRH